VLPVFDEQVRAQLPIGSEHRLLDADVRDAFATAGDGPRGRAAPAAARSSRIVPPTMSMRPSRTAPLSG
jgi:hypothetical protein